jgi:amino acid adenylation domain-containing protein
MTELRKLGVELRVDRDKLVCNAPKGVLTPELQAELASRKAEFITFLQTTATAAANDSQPIHKASHERPAPLSFAQKRLWYLDELEPGTATYNLPAAIRLSGDLCIDTLRQSLNEIVGRYEILRTRFAVEGEAPVQIVDDIVELSVPVVDISHLTGDDVKFELQRRLKDEARKPFDLAEGPLVRAVCFRIHDAEHALFFMAHHIVFDGLSIGLLVNELGALYAAFAAGKKSPLEDTSVQYGDYAIWQRDRLTDTEVERLLAYWRDQLGGNLPILQMPTDHSRPPMQSYEGATETIKLPGTLVNSLTELGRKDGATLFMVLLAAFKVLLHRYTNQSDFVIGTPINGRSSPELENSIGFFVNTLALRTDLSGRPSFRELLGRVKQSCLGAYGHQELPFERLVQELEVKRDLSRTPLFQAMFAYQDTSNREIHLNDLTLTTMRVDTEMSRTDLSCWVTQTDDGLSAVMEYSTDLFDRSTIVQVLQHYGNLLEAIVEDEDLPISSLPMLTPAELDQLLTGWNATDAEYPEKEQLHQLFEAQSDRSPDAVAVSFGDSELTYSELNCRANQLAHHLQSVGVARGALVGIYIDRSIEMLVGLLGILKAGGAYVPLDPDFPHERLAYMLSDAEISFLVSREGLLDQLAENDSEVICLDRDSAAISAHPVDNPSTDGASEELAYVIYTSGSTGKPKGVQVPHRGVVNFLISMQREPGLVASDRLLAVTTLSFDIATLELFLPLTVGARVVIADRSIASDGRKLLATLAEQEITVMQATPATWQLMIDAGWDRSLPVKVLCGGEAMLQDLAKALLQRSDSVWNLYGPTETTIWSTCSRISAPDGPVLIGEPIANTRIYVLDADMRPVPVGVAGEIYIGGSGVTRGYVNQPALTAERFLPDGFTNGDDLLYRTGDLGRWRSNGSLEHLGRIDSQVKVRGFRIELGEIESVLGEFPGLDRVVVNVWEAAAGDQRLAAFVVLSVGEAMDVPGMREHLSARLPGYMLPQYFVNLAEIPLTPNGKVDRKQLPEPTGSVAIDAKRPPETEAEVQVAAIWSNLLGIEQIGRDDNFFELGGHSLLAVKAVLELERVTGSCIELKDILMENLARIAQHLEREIVAGPIEVIPRDGHPPLSFAQERLWYLDRLEPNSTTYNIRCAVRMAGPLNVAILERSINEIVARYEILRTRFVIEEETPRQVIDGSLHLTIPVTDFSAVPEEEQETRLKDALQSASREPFDLAHGPLIRATCVRMNSTEHVLMLMMHHTVFDGSSHGFLLRELSTLYEAFDAGLESPLTNVPVQYGDYAIWQRDKLKREHDQLFAYWEDILSGELPVLQLPTDFPRPPRMSYRGASERIDLPIGLTESLTKIGREDGASLFMVLLSAFNVLLHRYTGQDDFIVGSPIDARNRPELAGSIGFLVNTLTLRSDLSGEPSFRDLLGRVKQTCLGAYSHQELPFEKLVQELDVKRELSRTPLFQTFFALQDIADRAVAAGELSLTPMPVDTEVSRTDLSFWIAQTENGLTGTMEYSTDLFERETISQLLHHFRNLLESIVEDRDCKIASLPILSNDERERLLVEWNATEASYPDEARLHDLFESQVRNTPNALAIVYGDERLTYDELNRRANQLANQLHSIGVVPGMFIGICLDRSIEMMVALLGVLKAGGAYVPLDPDFPNERLGYMLCHAEISILLTRESLIENLPEHNARVVCMDSNAPEFTDQTDENPHSDGSPDELAYVIYTSGSTGKPKGVQVQHRAVVNFLTSMRETPGITATDRLLAVTTLSFDIAVLELFLPLTVGGALVIANRDIVSDGARLLETLQSEAITVMQATPATWQLMIDSGWSASTPIKVLCGGEAMLPDLATELQKRSDSVWNLYGPTETTIWSTCTKVDKTEGPVLIGAPIANTQVYVLDRHMQPVPVGVAGELYIGGVGVTHGYVNQPELTAERFLPDTYTGTGQVYQTGDLARWRPDGVLEHLGRIDSQVKVRGFRIELGEIESVLSEHPTVDRVAVNVWDAGSGDQRLVAYLVISPGESLDPISLRKHLNTRLPNYMLPQHYIQLQELPLTPNGKTDRKKLPAPSGLIDGNTRQPPVTPAEKLIAKIWSELLGVENIGRHDNFFELGGHSLLAVRALLELEKASGTRIELRHILLEDLFQIGQHLRSYADEDSPQKNSGDGGFFRRFIGW